LVKKYKNQDIESWLALWTAVKMGSKAAPLNSLILILRL
ncbi:MAG: hypothetical protein ACD_20C00429G0001, partial [uncultured bacterium]